jgi:hypothetical protein
MSKRKRKPCHSHRKHKPVRKLPGIDLTQRPKPGDTIFFCAHLRKGNIYECPIGSHWFGIGAVPFTSPTGEKGIAKWYNCCNSCYQALEGDPRKLFTITPLGGHVVLNQTPPIDGKLS